MIKPRTATLPSKLPIDSACRESPHFLTLSLLNTSKKIIIAITDTINQIGIYIPKVKQT